MIRILDDKNLVFKSDLLLNWPDLASVTVTLTKNCCAPSKTWSLRAPQHPDINEFDVDEVMAVSRYVEFLTAEPYEIKGVRVLNTVDNTIHLLDLSSLSTWAALDGREVESIFIEESIAGSQANRLQGIPDTDTYFNIFVVNPVNWELLGLLVSDINGECKTVPMIQTFSHQNTVSSEADPKGVYIGYNTVTITPEVCGEESFADGIYNVTLGVSFIDNSLPSVAAYAFVDTQIKCDLVEFMAENPYSTIYHTYFTLKNGIFCNECGPQKICDLYESLYKTVYKTNEYNGCGCN